MDSLEFRESKVHVVMAEQLASPEPLEGQARRDSRVRLDRLELREWLELKDLPGRRELSEIRDNLDKLDNPVCQVSRDQMATRARPALPEQLAILAAPEQLEQPELRDSPVELVGRAAVEHQGR